MNIIKPNFDSNITVVAATKGQTADTINMLPNNGINIAGENRVQEMLSKYDSIDKSITFHMIGQLQTNKVKYIINKVSLIQSVDRLNLAQEIDKQAKKNNLVMPVLVELNLGGEENKGGVSVSGFDKLVDEINRLPNIQLQGIMTVMPKNAHSGLYKQMYIIYNNLRVSNSNIKYLSMGMSDDYQIALDNGSNMLRLGRAIFRG